MENTEKINVAVLGASAKPERYSNKAVKQLLNNGYEVFPVNPGRPVIHGLKCLAGLPDIPVPIHTLSLYVSAEVSARSAQNILALAPGRVIFNPGAENPDLMQKLEEKGIRTLEACTLVLLSTGQF